MREPGGLVHPGADRVTMVAIGPLDLHVVAAASAKSLIPPTTVNEPAPLPPGNLAEVLDEGARDPAAAGARTSARLRSLIGQGRYRLSRSVMAIHRMQRGTRTSTGLVAALSRAAFTSDAVLPHEATHRERELRLDAFLTAARLDVSPIIGAYGKATMVDAAVGSLTQRRPDEAFTDQGGTQHEIWIIDDQQVQATLRAAVARVRHITVIDGHHRLATARADSQADAVMVELFRDRDLDLLAFDRQVALPEADIAGLVTRLQHHTGVELVVEARPSRPVKHDEFLLHARRWFRARFVGTAVDFVSGLSPVRLQDEVLAPLCGITDPRTDTRLRHWPATRPPNALGSDRINDVSVYFVPAAVSMEDIHRVARRRQVLPPKSTFVAGKPPPGIFVAPRAQQVAVAVRNSVA